MEIGYIVVGVFVLIMIFLAILYFVNSRKMKKSETKKKEEKKKDSEKKLEVKSEILKESPVDTAKKEANAQEHMEEAYKKIEDEREMFEKDNAPKQSKHRLKLERDEFKTELQKSLETAKISSETNVLKSQYQKMDYEQEIAEGSEIDVQMAKPEEVSKAKSLQDEIENLSPEMKAILIDNLLNKKY